VVDNHVRQRLEPPPPQRRDAAPQVGLAAVRRVQVLVVLRQVSLRGAARLISHPLRGNGRDVLFWLPESSYADAGTSSRRKQEVCSHQLDSKQAAVAAEAAQIFPFLTACGSQVTTRQAGAAHLIADGLAGRRQPDGRDAGVRDGVRLVRQHLQPRRLAGLVPDAVALPVERLQCNVTGGRSPHALLQSRPYFSQRFHWHCCAAVPSVDIQRRVMAR